MKLDIFRPSDFQGIFNEIFNEGFKARDAGGRYEVDYGPEHIVNHAHKILSERGRVVYGALGLNGFYSSEVKSDADSHQGLLIGVREIEKECVEHEPTVNYSFGIYDTTKPVCKICGKKLKAKWSVVK